MDLLVSASFITSFFAGVAALFAPCCVTVLLPTYFASIFKQKATVFLMTFVYFLGLLLVFLPIGLGVSAFSQIFSNYHDLFFLLGSIFLTFLGLTLVLGLQVSFPVLAHPKLNNHGLGSVFILGIFSGIATTCCAPVLAGVLTIAALPASFLLSFAYTLAYVLGMVVPLFILSALIDKTGFTKKFFAFRKTVGYSLLGRKIYLSLSNLFSGLMFLILGIYIFYLSFTNNLTSHSTYQVTINLYLAKLTKTISRVTMLIPDIMWAVIIIIIFLILVFIAIKQFLDHKND